MTKNEFYDKWLNVFAANISQEDREKYIVSYGNYIWHAFSWELLDKNVYLVGDAAREAYDRIDKSGAVYLRWFDDEQTAELSEDLRTAQALEALHEVYVVSRDFSWTYIKTHERDLCGPYFMKR